MSSILLPYTAQGLQVTRQRPKANFPPNNGLTTNNSQYDSLGRLLRVTYDDGTPTKSFSYDQSGNGGSISQAGASNGQLTGMTTVTTSATPVTLHSRSYAYDIGGRITQTVECLPGWCGDYTHDVFRFYGYDFLGDLTTDRYASSGNGQSYATIGYGYNAASQLTSIGGGQNNASSVTIYGVTESTLLPFGPQTAAYGNGLIATSQYDSVGRESGRWLCGAPGGVNCPGGVNTYRFGFAVHQVGSQVQWETDTTINRFTDFSYDDMGRLTRGTSHSGATGLTFNATYDRYGNCWTQDISNTATGWIPPPAHFTFNTANQISSIPQLTYDGAGNMISDGQNYYSYDAENNLTAVSGGQTATYVYNGFNQRMEAITSAGTDRYGLDLLGRRSTTWLDQTTALKLVEYYGDQGPVAFYSGADGNIHFEHGDSIGSEHYRSDIAGNQESTFASLPFGELVESNGPDASPSHFALLDQDLNSNANLSHAMFREYSSFQGRWTSPDPYQGSYDDGNPQSLNRYTYVLNNPLVYKDPQGLDLCDIFCFGLENEDQNSQQAPANPVRTQLTTSSFQMYGDEYHVGSSFDYSSIFDVFGRAAQATSSLLNAQNKVGCNTVLPNGKVLGQYINQGRAQLQASVNAGGSFNGGILAKFAAIARDYGPIDFKNGAAGTSVLSSRAFLGQAGNFAYYAIGSGYLSPRVLDLGASVYSHAAVLLRNKPLSTLTGPLGIDASAASVRNPGLATRGCPK